MPSETADTWRLRREAADLIEGLFAKVEELESGN